MLNRTITIAGPTGGGMQHLRVLLALTPEGQCVTPTGQDVALADRAEWICREMYPMYRAHAPGDGWQRAEQHHFRYWHTMDIIHRPDRPADIRFFIRPGGSAPIRALSSWKVRAMPSEPSAEWFQRPAGCIEVALPDFYLDRWPEHHLAAIAERLGLGTPDMASALRVHSAWCRINRRIWQRVGGAPENA